MGILGQSALGVDHFQMLLRLQRFYNQSEDPYHSSKEISTESDQSTTPVVYYDHSNVSVSIITRSPHEMKDSTTRTLNRFNSEATSQCSFSRKMSQGSMDRHRRPSYPCVHGHITSRGRRGNVKLRRQLDILQLAAGATMMVAPLTPDILR